MEYNGYTIYVSNIKQIVKNRGLLFDVDTNGKIIDWVLPSGTGQKTVYAQFKVDGFWLSNIFTYIS